MLFAASASKQDDLKIWILLQLFPPDAGLRCKRAVY